MRVALDQGPDLIVLAEVELDPLLEASAIALIAGVGITLAFALGLRALISAAERRREGETASAALAAGLGGLALLAAAGSVVAGLALVA